MLMPTHYCQTVYDIPFEMLWRQGIRGICFDLDNTLSSYQEQTMPKRVEQLLDKLSDMGFLVMILSNNNKERVDRYLAGRPIPWVARAKKPLTFCYRQAQQVLGLPVDQIVSIGDQIFTDTAGASLAGIRTILVESISPRENLFCHFKRLFERPVLRRCRRGEALPFTEVPR